LSAKRYKIETCMFGILSFKGTLVNSGCHSNYTDLQETAN
jgi:hypothetical protein